MRLRGARVVVRADLPGEKIGSIYIPERAQKQPLIGTVELKGEGCTELIEVGDRVIFPSRSWSRFNAPGYGFPYVLLWEKDLIAKVEADEGARPA